MTHIVHASSLTTGDTVRPKNIPAAFNTYQGLLYTRFFSVHNNIRHCSLCIRDTKSINKEINQSIKQPVNQNDQWLKSLEIKRK